jgi:hypothetical protein
LKPSPIPCNWILKQPTKLQSNEDWTKEFNREIFSLQKVVTNNHPKGSDIAINSENKSWGEKKRTQQHHQHLTETREAAPPTTTIKTQLRQQPP